MAEIEMEVDMGRPLELGSHMEDDLIDFDTDMADQREPTSLHAGDDHDLLGSEGIIFDAVHADHHVEQETDAVMSEEVELGDIEDAMHDVEEIQNDDNPEVEQEFYNTEAYDQETEHQPQEEEEGGYAEISHEKDETTQETDREQVHHPDNEIDYELEEHTEQHESHDGELELETVHGPDPAEPEDTVEHPVKEDISQHVEDITTQEAGGGYDEPDQRQDLAEEDEITYDEVQDHEPESERPQELDELEALEETQGQEDEAVHVSTEDATRDRVDDSQHEDQVTGDEDVDGEDSKEQGTVQDETTEDPEADEYYVSADVGEDHNDEQEVASERDQSVSGQGSAAVSDSGFPAITVHYKGDEFPLFSNTSYGFFTEMSMLDETMGKLLSNFRAELASEICDEDELVFQIDELGLEFAESTWRDSLSGVTLQHILEIFELLVKNQDPDDTRTLYTYLFTKPCASKRLEFLIESATAGKGLGEVVHLFQSPIGAASNAIAAANAAEDDNIEHLDEYDSPAEETNESNDELENQEAEEGAEPDSSPVGDEDTGEGDQPAAGEYDEEVDQPVAEEYDEEADQLVAGEYDEEVDQPAPEEYDEEVDQPAVEEYDEGNDQPAADEYDEEGDEPATDEYNVGDDIEQGANDVSQPQDEEAFDTDAAEPLDQTNAHDESESNPFVNLELDNDVNEDEVDLEAYDAEEQYQLNLDTVNVGTANTSTTATLKDDDETGSVVVDVGADVTAPELEETTEAGQEDEVEEIDWRDQPDTDHEAPMPASPAGKRARGDDDIDAEDEQDAKRRRS